MADRKIDLHITGDLSPYVAAMSAAARSTNVNWYQSLPPFVRATLERMVRGGIAAVVAAYVAGGLVVDNINVDTFDQALTLFVGGAVTALLLALGVQVGTKGKGPALTSAENLTPVKHRPNNQAGRAGVGLMLAVVGLVGALIALLTFAAPAEARHDTNWPCAECLR